MAVSVRSGGGGCRWRPGGGGGDWGVVVREAVHVLARDGAVRPQFGAPAIIVLGTRHQNLTLADMNGVAMQMIGAMPKRDPAHQSQGRMPAPGWIAANRWQGVMPYENNPRVVNPASGIVGNTNNKTVDRPFPDHVSFDWGDTQRIQRWLTLMKAREVHTRESFIEAQLRFHAGHLFA